jgi:hypothetical protein
VPALHPRRGRGSAGPFRPSSCTARGGRHAPYCPLGGRKARGARGRAPLTRSGARARAQAVLSACFESGVALAHYVALAAAAPPPRVAHGPAPRPSHAAAAAPRRRTRGARAGLGTFARLAEDLLDPPFAALAHGGTVAILDADAALAAFCAARAQRL